MITETVYFSTIIKKKKKTGKTKNVKTGRILLSVISVFT